MQKDLLGLIEQATVLLLGGILGGRAAQIATTDYGFYGQMGRYLILLLTAIFAITFLHFLVSYQRVRRDMDDDS